MMTAVLLQFLVMCATVFSTIQVVRLILSTGKLVSHMMSKYAVIVTAYLWTVLLSSQVACTIKVFPLTHLSMPC